MFDTRLKKVKDTLLNYETRHYLNCLKIIVGYLSHVYYSTYKVIAPPNSIVILLVWRLTLPSRVH